MNTLIRHVLTRVYQLECVWCHARLRHHGPLPHQLDTCPVCSRDTLIVVSTRATEDPVLAPDRRTS